MGNSNSQGKPKSDQQPEAQEGSVRCHSFQDEIGKPQDSTNDNITSGDSKTIENGGCKHQTNHVNHNDDSLKTVESDSEETVTDAQYISSKVELDNKDKLVDLAAKADSKSSTGSVDVDTVHVFPEPEGTANDADLDSTTADIDQEPTNRETTNEKTGYVDLQDVTSTSEPIPEVDEDQCSEQSEDQLSEDKKFETVMRVVIHSINDITRSTDIGSDVDPFVEVRANHVLLGATRPKTDMTTASVEESFYIKTERNPRSIKLKFHLKDQDHMTDDDLLGHGYFDLAEEDNTMNQTVHLKWKGTEIGTILVSVDFQNLVVM